MFQDLIVEAIEKLGFVSNAQNVAFLCIEFHSPFLGPGFKLLQVILEGYVVMELIDFSVDKTNHWQRAGPGMSHRKEGH